jgi:hypothetical protein
VLAACRGRKDGEGFTNLVDSPFYRSHHILQMHLQILQAARIKQYSALKALTTGCTGGARAGLRMPICAAASICSRTLVSALSYGLLLRAQDLDFGSGEAERGVCDGLSRGHGRQVPRESR